MTALIMRDGPSRTSVRSARFLVWKTRRDVRTILRHGPSAPRLFQTVWFKVEECRHVSRRFLHLKWAARIIDGDWDLDVEPIESLFARQPCHQHWVEGRPWEDTGVNEKLLARIDAAGEAVDGCSAGADVVERFQRVDRLFEEVAREGRLL